MLNRTDCNKTKEDSHKLPSLVVESLKIKLTLSGFYDELVGLAFISYCLNNYIFDGLTCGRKSVLQYLQLHQHQDFQDHNKK
jgi:hypothetical protein